MLVFHIKRFDLSGRKISKFQEYPVEIDMSKYQDRSDNIDNQSTSYSLIGLTEHVGSSDYSGHYIAYTLRGNSWYKFDDEFFKRVSEKDALKREAYLLFYQRNR